METLASTPLRVGVIGAGSWSRICHIPCVQAHNRAEVAALCGRREYEAALQAQEFGIPSVYTNFADLIDSTEIDAVTIATPNVFHSSIALAALAAGKHVFCEKPLAMNTIESREMLRIACETGVVHQVAFTFRHLHASCLAKRMIADGEIGTIYRVSGYAEGASGLNPNKPYNWRDTLELSGTGMLGDMGSHIIDLARFVTGLEFKSVAGSMRTLHRSQQAISGPPITTDDETEFLAHLDNGVDGYFHISRIVHGETRSYLEVCGDMGALRIHYSRGNIDALYHCPANTRKYELVTLPEGAQPEHNHALYKMLAAYIDACNGLPPAPDTVATFADGHRAQLVIDAVVRSAQMERSWVVV